MSYVDEVYERVVRENPSQPEFHQAVREVLARCAKDADAYRAGNQKVFGFLVGQTMKALGGKADAKKIGELLRERLGK